VLAVVAGAAGVAPAQPAAGQTGPPVVGTVLVPRHSSIVATTKLAADYYRPTYRLATGVRNGWSWGTYFQGVQALFGTSGDQRYFTDGMAWGQSNQWSVTTAELNPDSVKAGQTYYDLNRLDPGAALATMDTRMSTDLTGLPVGAYWWADALFMGLPNWTRWATRTGNTGYLDKMDALYGWTRDHGATRCAGAPDTGLYDRTERLWYRDCGYLTRRGPHGGKVFWSRGNGWVLAAMAQVLNTLPAGDPHAAGYRQMFTDMAARVAALQGPDGFWRPDLTDPLAVPQAETSGTALFTYAMAYGVSAGLLDRASYLPVIARAWAGLITAVQPSGFLSRCQPVGSEPAQPYTQTAPRTAPTATSAGTLHADSPPFCVGAFLLAGSEMARLAGPMSTGKPVSATAEQVGNEAARAVDGRLTTRWSAAGFPQSLTVDLGDFYRASNAMVVPFVDRAYRYRIETSTDGVHWTLVVDRTSNTTGGTKVDNFGPGTVNLRYARLTVTGVSGDPTGWVSIQEFAVHDRYDPRPNLARGRPTAATSSQAAFPASNATDNESATFWSSAVLPTAAAPEELTVDLQTPATVDTVRVSSRTGSGPRDVAVLGSVDGVAWTVLATATLPDAEGPHMMVVPATPARWLRLRTTNAYGASNVQVEEFEAFEAFEAFAAR